MIIGPRQTTELFAFEFADVAETYPCPGYLGGVRLSGVLQSCGGLFCARCLHDIYIYIYYAAPRVYGVYSVLLCFPCMVFHVMEGTDLL